MYYFEDFGEELFADPTDSCSTVQNTVSLDVWVLFEEVDEKAQGVFDIRITENAKSTKHTIIRSFHRRPIVISLLEPSLLIACFVDYRFGVVIQFCFPELIDRFVAVSTNQSTSQPMVLPFSMPSPSYFYSFCYSFNIII